MAGGPVLSDVGGAFGERPDEREDGCPGLADPCGITTPLKIKDVGVVVIDPSAVHGEPSVLLTPLFDMGSKMGIWLLGHPRRLAERGDQFASSCHQLPGVPDAAPTVIAIPTTRHERTVQGPLMPRGSRDRADDWMLDGSLA